MTLVVLETARLALKTFSLEDALGFYELNLDPEVLRYTGDVPFRSIAEAEAFIRGYDHYDRHGFGRWSVFIRDTAEYIGFCGLNYRPELDEVDVGFRLLRRYWGNSYATEAARASILHGFETCGLSRIVARARRENLASLRVMENLGMRFEKEFFVEGALWVQYEITKEAVDGSVLRRLS